MTHSRELFCNRNRNQHGSIVSSFCIKENNNCVVVQRAKRPARDQMPSSGVQGTVVVLDRSFEIKYTYFSNFKWLDL